MWPAYLPSMAMWMMVPTLWQGMYGTPSRSISLSLPAATGMAVHLGDDAVAADLLDIRHPAAVDLLAVGPLQALADGVGGGALRQSGVLQQLLVLHLGCGGCR